MKLAFKLRSRAPRGNGVRSLGAEKAVRGVRQLAILAVGIDRQSNRCSLRDAATRLVDGLEKSGLAVRRPHPTDRRATLVSLTESGTGLARTWQAQYHRLATRLLGDVDRATLTKFGAMLEHPLRVLRLPDG